MSKTRIKGFVISWTPEKAFCYIVDTKEIREFDRNYLFMNFHLFKGKNVWFDVEIVPGTMTMQVHESLKNKVIQLWNYYIKKDFKP